MKYCYLCGKIKDKSVSLHKFPKHDGIRSLWLKACDLLPSDNVLNLKLCGKHFKSEDFYDLNARNFGGHICLKNHAFPSVHVPNSDEDVTLISHLCVSKSDLYLDLSKPSTTSISECTILETNQPQTSICCDLKPDLLTDQITPDKLKSDTENPSTPKKGRFSEPQYPLEITSPDVKTSRRAKRLIQLAEATISQKSKQIRNLQESNRYLKKRVQSLKHLILNLQKNNFLSEDAANS